MNENPLKRTSCKRQAWPSLHPFCSSVNLLSDVTDPGNLLFFQIHVPCRHHKVVKGYIAEEAVEECSHVTVAFPLPGTGSDEVVVHGSCESVAKVVGELEDFWMSSCIA